MKQLRKTQEVKSGKKLLHFNPAPSTASPILTPILAAAITFFVLPISPSFFLVAQPINPIAQQQDSSLQIRAINTIGIHKDRTASISAGDIDGDGDQDLIIANGRHWPGQNRIFLNNGKGGFTVERNLLSQRETTYAAPLADLDGDGDLDIVVGNDRAPSYVLLNDGTGQFQRSQVIGGISNTRSITLADIDNKNGIDILVTNRREPNQIFFNDGAGSFNRSRLFGTKEDSTIDVAVADMNSDGHNDLVVANRDGQQNYVYIGDDSGNFTESVKYGTGSDETRGVAVVDFDRDGHLDILNANIGQPNAIYFGDGQGGFERSIKFGGNDNSYHLQCARLNNNSEQLSIVVANAGSQNAVYQPNADGTFVETLFGIENGATYGIALIDINGDGQPEIATANSDENNALFRLIIRPN